MPSWASAPIHSPEHHQCQIWAKNSQIRRRPALQTATTTSQHRRVQLLVRHLACIVSHLERPLQDRAPPARQDATPPPKLAAEPPPRPQLPRHRNSPAAAVATGICPATTSGGGEGRWGGRGGPPAAGSGRPGAAAGAARERVCFFTDALKNIFMDYLLSSRPDGP